jgi:thiamine biosynthesis lipoprotein
MSKRAWVAQIMGLPISVHVRGPDPSAAEPEVERLFDDLRHADAVFSTYRDDSELSRWERGELALEDADPALAEVIGLCAEATRRTDGWFDPHRLPDPHTGLPRYDPSGLVKGWAVERAASRLSTSDGYGWCLNAGGDVLVHTPAEQPGWRVGVEDPYDPRRIMRVLEVRDGAVASSGTAHRGAHLVDPHTGAQVAKVAAVTVIGPSLLWADVYATAAAVSGPGSRAWPGPGYEVLYAHRF